MSLNLEDLLETGEDANIVVIGSEGEEVRLHKLVIRKAGPKVTEIEGFKQGRAALSETDSVVEILLSK